MDGIECPVTIDGIEKFETQNPDYQINVYTYDIKAATSRQKRHISISNLKVHEQDLLPERKHKVKLLLVNKHTESEVKHHYVLIKNFDGLMRNANGTLSESHQKFYCDRCHCHKTTKQLLKDHRSRPCGDTKLVFPKKRENFMYIKNHSKKLLTPFYTDTDAE